ncbi:ferritin-like domain-containing protein [Leptolyngbya cf. ectocarpi LEGE 11479]|uniref:Ferritin-like domain-containing protein n=1 Tax=Leptolyngbya cf. ectocarpi LEGE 11479 TaxID=1828722 RepID=A0A928ZUT8_LEPEC|nr:ferritin-like domain-containing protein [Leptolyngbya ectocarpi]MBE9067800.1 ferritin-like domain-containing protein [Leptolyngbya cf. ectocarpi LEGE 11479]
MITDKLSQVSGFDLPVLTSNNKVTRVLTAALRERDILHAARADSNPIYWQADYFDLDRVSIFQDASEPEQRQILQQLNQDLLQESLAIEQAGVGYMAKMVLMAESSQERLLYSLFTADETSHLVQLQPYGAAYGPSIDAPPKVLDPFLQLLADIVESTDKALLLFVLQVVLEGWGLTHYRRLAGGCKDNSLRELFRSFLQVESRHHGAGVTLFRQSYNQSHLSSSSQSAIVDCLASFLQMVRVGPQRVVSAIATAKGHLSRPQRLQILQQLDTVTHSHQRLQLLRSLMASTESSIVSELEHKGLFIPLSPEEAASYG